MKRRTINELVGLDDLSGRVAALEELIGTVVELEVIEAQGQGVEVKVIHALLLALNATLTDKGHQDNKATE